MKDVFILNFQNIYVVTLSEKKVQKPSLGLYLFKR